MSSVNKTPIADLYQQGMSIPQIAEMHNIPPSTVRSRLIRAGVALRSRADGVRLAASRIGDALRGKARHFSDEHRSRIAVARREHGEKHAAGVSVKPNGYVEHTRGEHKGRSLHVTTMEARLGRRLRPDECVHHIDGNRQNNDPDNLALVTRAGHTRLHRREERLRRGASCPAQ